MNEQEVRLFCDWLREHGAEVLAPTNRYEIVRFRANRETNVIYRNSKNQISSYVGKDAEKAHDAFVNDKPWRGGIAKPRRNMSPQRRALLERDGNECFYCGLEFDLEHETPTIEHICSITSGGPHHIANLALAHELCNKEGGSLSVVEKVKMREIIRAQYQAMA